MLVIGTPNEKQKQYFLADAGFIAYGGARGGGKSWANRRKAEMLALHYAGCRILFLRRTLKELRENHMEELRRDLAGIATWKEIDSRFTFGNGSSIKLGYCDSEKDVDQYQGQEYDFIFLDEATQFTEYQFSTLTACIRGANSFPKRMYLTCNPGGVGHGWVKRLFIDREYRGGEQPEDYVFIQARFVDNTALMDKDPGYARMLDRLPEELRRAWRDGDWDVFAGQYFDEWAEEKNTEEGFAPPAHWPRYFAMDYGLDMLAAYLAAVDEAGRVHIYRELAATGLVIPDAAKAVKRFCAGEDIRAYYAPPDMWNRRQDTGRSVADRFAEEGIGLQRVSNDRVTGWITVKEYLAGEKPRMMIAKSCGYLIRSIPLLLADTKHPGDVLGEPHEATHGPDAIRYLLSGWPEKAMAQQTDEEPEAVREKGQEESWIEYGR